MSDKLETPLNSTRLEEIEDPVDHDAGGFLPIETNWFDRLFISVVLWVALSLFWFRFIEPAGLSIWISNVIALALTVLIISKG